MKASPEMLHAVRRLIDEASATRGAGAELNLTVKLQHVLGEDVVHAALTLPKDTAPSVYVTPGRSRYRCGICEDWLTVVPRNGGHPVACPAGCSAAPHITPGNHTKEESK